MFGLNLMVFLEIHTSPIKNNSKGPIRKKITKFENKVNKKQNKM